jgi:hypothetical protein
MKVRFPNRREIRAGLITIAVTSILYFVIHIYENIPQNDLKLANSYMWVFKDSVKADMDTLFRFSEVNKRYIKNDFVYKEHYPIEIWDFKDLYSLDLKDVIIHKNINLPDLDINYGKGAILDAKCNTRKQIIYSSSFDSRININLDESSTIIKTIESRNYKGFYGIVNRMAFTNGKGEDYLLFDHPKGKQQTLLLVYTSLKGTFVIIVGTNDKAYTFDENIINIFNLK